MPRRSLLVPVLVLVALAPGCAEELGPERMETTRVTGVVTEGLRPVRGGFIEFCPTDGTIGNLTSAPIRLDGKFVAEAVAIGKNRIGIVAAPLTLPNASYLFDTLGTPIRRDIRPGPSSDLTINLLDEIVLYQKKAEAARR